MRSKLVSINVRGLSSSRKTDVILHELERLPYDLFLLSPLSSLERFPVLFLTLMVAF